MLLVLGIMTVGQVLPQLPANTAASGGNRTGGGGNATGTPQEGIIVRRLCRCGKEVST